MFVVADCQGLKSLVRGEDARADSFVRSKRVRYHGIDGWCAQWRSVRCGRAARERAECGVVGGASMAELWVFTSLVRFNLTTDNLN